MYDVRTEPLQSEVNQYESRDTAGRGDQTKQKQFKYKGKGGNLSLSAPASRMPTTPGRQRVRARTKKRGR